MTLTIADAGDDAARFARGMLPLWVGIFSFALLVLAGDKLLIDPDTQWQITVGQWILDHRAVPESDVFSFTMRGQPWISTQWLAQVAYAKVYAWFGWSGPVVLAAAASAATFALLARYLSRTLSETAVLVFVLAAFALTAPHILARPHVLAFPVMVAWIGGLVAAADRHDAPPPRLLPLMALPHVGAVVTRTQTDRMYRLVARHRISGELAGQTVVIVPAVQPWIASQLDTSVVEGHRGHRLGMSLKIAMLRELAEAEPQVRTLETWNAASNSYMIAVNETLGYRVVSGAIEWQKHL